MSRAKPCFIYDRENTQEQGLRETTLASPPQHLDGNIQGASGDEGVECLHPVDLDGRELRLPSPSNVSTFSTTEPLPRQLRSYSAKGNGNEVVLPLRRTKHLQYDGNACLRPNGRAERQHTQLIGASRHSPAVLPHTRLTSAGDGRSGKAARLESCNIPSLPEHYLRFPIPNSILTASPCPQTEELGSRGCT